ncbi:MAG: glycosyltransferase family 4 protein [Candidatus Hydrogenedentes bacterium]|nr:glycosyltransferase family 4 protein [Candidatus Hydrogenedentota bacterium]
MPVNVLYLIRTWALGGSHTIVWLLLENLPRDRFNIICVPYDTPDGGDAKFVEVLRGRGLDVAPERIPWQSRFHVKTAWAAVSDLIKRYSVDLIHTHDPHSNVLIGLGRKRWPCACVASAYGWFERWLPLRSHVYTWLEKRVALPRFDRVITVSQHLRTKILAGGTSENRVRVIHTGLPLNPMQPTKSRTDSRRALGIPDDACVVGTVSRLYVEKGHCYLLAAMQRLASRYPQLRGLVVGDGPERARLEHEATRLGIADQVVFTGYYPDLPGALSAMDFLAHPSVLDEGLPTAVLEAQLAGLPIVASDIGGTRETVDVGKTGLLTPPRDTRALAEALETLVSNPAQRKAMGQAARTWVENAFRLDTMIAEMTTTYAEAIAACRKTP